MFAPYPASYGLYPSASPLHKLKQVSPVGENVSDMDHLPLCATFVKGQLWTKFGSDSMTVVQSSCVEKG